MRFVPPQESVFQTQGPAFSPRGRYPTRSPSRLARLSRRSDGSIDIDDDLKTLQQGRRQEIPLRLGGRREDGSGDTGGGPLPTRFVSGILRQALSEHPLHPTEVPVRYSQAAFSRHVLNNFPAARQMGGDETYRVPLEGQRTLYVDYNPVHKHAWILFANDREDEGAFTHGKTLRRGSLGLFRSLGRLLKDFHRSGIGVSFEADRRKGEVYHGLLTKIGFERSNAKGDPIYHPVGTSPTMDPEKLSRHSRSRYSAGTLHGRQGVYRYMLPV